MASDWLRKKAEEQAKSITEKYGDAAYGGLNWLKENTSNTEVTSTGEAGKVVASDWLRAQAAKYTDSKEGTAYAVPQAFLPKQAILPGKYVQRQLGDDVLPSGEANLSAKMQRYEATKQAQNQADIARKAYEDYTVSGEYQDYLKEQWNPYAGINDDDLEDGFLYTAGIEPAQKMREDSRAAKARELKAQADYYERLARQAKDEQTLQNDMEEFESWPEEDREALKTFIINSNRENYDFTMDPQLRGNAAWKSSALIQKYGIGKVRQMAESYGRWENMRNSQTIQKAAEQAAGEKPGWSSVGSIAANALGNITGVGGYIGEMAGRTGRYSTLDPNNIGSMPAVAAGTVREKVGQRIEEGATGKVGSTLYKAGMSAADNFVRMVMGGGTGSLALAASGSFGQTLNEASKRGIAPGKAAGVALASATFEVLTEKVSLDNLLAQAAGGKQTFRQIMKNALKAGGVEISEEEMSFALNQIAEHLFLQGDSSFNQRISELMAQGMSFNQANEEATIEVMLEAVETGIVSGLSGGMMSGGTSLYTNTVETIAKRHQGKQAAPQQEAESMILDEGEVEGLSLATPNVRMETTDRVKQKFIDQAGRLSKALGREIVFYSAEATENGIENGRFQDGVIYVNTRSRNALAQIVSHELTHSTEFADAYQDLSKVVFDKFRQQGIDLQSMRRNKADLYARNGHALKDMNAVDQEIVAEFVERYLLTDEQTILDVAAQNRTLGQRIMGWIDGLLAKFGNNAAQERAFLTNARNLWAKALEQSRRPDQNRIQGMEETKNPDAKEYLELIGKDLREGNISEEEFDEQMEYVDQQEEMESSGEQYSFAGPNARNADLNALKQAQQMDRQGVANETIRQQTGWFKGMDGKWRFEVDDSTTRISGNISNYMTLGELLQDAGILKLYPNLEDISVVFQSLDPGVNASYNPQFDSIDVSYKLKNDPDAVKSAVLHEIQHAIQRWEGFTKGTNVRAWERKIKAGFDSRKAADIRALQEAEQKIQQLREEDPALYRDLMELDAMAPNLPRGKIDWDTLEQIEEDPPEWQAYDARRDELEEIYGDRMWDFNSALYDLQRISKRPARTAEELYWDTAGEIEARNVADRRNLIAEERKNKPPILGGEDTVFVEGSEGYSMSKAESDSVKEQIRKHQKELDNMDPVARVSTNAWRGMSKESYTNQVVMNLRKTGNKVDRQNFGIIEFSESDLRTGMKYMNTDAEAAAFYAIPQVLKRGIQVEGHDNHKGRGYDTTTFVAPVELNGKRGNMAVVVKFTKGNRYKVHRILTPEGGKFALPDMANAESTIGGGITRGATLQGEVDPPINSASNNTIADTKPHVKQFSISATDKRGIANDLRSILNRGGDPAELRQYISSLEQSGGNSEQRGRNAEQNGALRIIQAAKSNGISVEEYLRQNWEQYDVDGEWNADAREALDLERKGRRYSISETGEETGEKKTAEQIREEMPEKARSHLIGAERNMLKGLGEKLGVSKFQNREELQGIVREIADEYLENGTISDEKLGFLFDRAYAGGIVADAEFYEQNKDIKDHLRTTGVTLSQQDQKDIADFQDFRKRAFGTVKIVSNGLPVDSAYHELHEMAPELFPESITHPADQLVRMYEVGQSIRVAEVGLQKFQGEMAEEYRKYARNDFDRVINDTVAELRSVKRVAQEAEQKRSEQSAAPTTPEEAKEVYRQLKDARKVYEKARAKNLLSDSDEMQVGRLLKGEILPEYLDPDNDNIRAIMNVYEAKKEYERLSKQIAEYKKSVKAAHREKADKLLETAINWKDKKAGIAYSRETMERNVYDIVPDRVVAEQIIDTYFTPVHEGEAMAVRFKNQYRDMVRDLNLSRKVQKGNLVSEAHAVQLLGEAEDNIRVLQNSRGRMKQRDGKTLAEWQGVIDELWRQSPHLDEGKIRRGVAEFRQIYDQLFEQMNEVRIRNGYEPVNYRQGYFPHFQPGNGDGILAHFGKALGVDTQVDVLPTSINGLTHTFKPGIQWFGNAQERLGFNTAYDAVEGFDKYIEGVASVIYQTDNIQNLRALESQIRYRTTDEGIRKQVDAVNNDSRLTEEEKQSLINSIYEHGRYTLSNFVTEVSEYTNLLANKKSKLDRTTEALIGRRAYTIMKNWESRVGANMIAGNISSALTNFIPLTQAGAQLSSDSMLKGMWDTLKAYKADDGITGMSTFLTNRRGSDPLVKTWAQTASEKMRLNLLMDLVDGFTSDSIVRAAYYQNLKNGLSEAEAMLQADVFASSVMADRSKGAMPTLFESRNPVLKMFTQFQLEVNNQFSEIFKDLPRRYREKGMLVLGGVMLKYFIGAFLFNELYEFFAGRRPALDPISMLNDTVGDLTGYQMPNIIEWIGGDARFETEKVGLAEAGKNLASTALGELPFSSGLTMLGIETDGGRLPASSAVPDLTALWDAATEEGWSPEKRWKEAKDELGKLMYVVPPFGGNQIQKMWKGVKAYAEGGSYNVDKDGNDILQYPVYKDSTEDKFWSLVRAAFMGKSSLPEAQDWVESGFDSLGAKQTAVYQDLLEAGSVDREAYGLIRQLEKTSGMKSLEKKQEESRILAGAPMGDEEKKIIVGYLIGTEMVTESGNPSQYAKFLTATDRGLSIDTYMELRASGADVEDLLEATDAGMNAEAAAEFLISQANQTESMDLSKVDRWRLSVDFSQDVTDQLALLSLVMTEAQHEQVELANRFKVDPRTYVDVCELLPKYDTDGNGAYKQGEIKEALDSTKLSREQKAVLWQVLASSTKSSKNNPYSQEIGQKILDARN